MRLRLLPCLLATILLTVPAFSDEVAVWRLFVADHAAPLVHVVDVASGDTIETFNLAAPASLYALKSGEGVFAVQGEANQVSAISTGVSFADHGDHGDLSISAPALIDTVATGERPVHFVEHGAIALFYDASGKADILDPKAWLQDGKLVGTTVDSGAPHHGVAVPWRDLTLVSAPVDVAGQLPSGINVFDAAGTLVDSTKLCADLHGEAASGDLVAFGCSDGVLIVSGGAKPEFRLLPFSNMPEGRVGSLLGGASMQYFLGNYGPDKLVLVDPSSEQPFRLVNLPFPRVHFTLDPANPRFAYVLTSDGKVHQLDVISGKLLQSTPVTGTYSTEGGHGAAMPRLAVAGEQLAVSDPATGQIHLVDIASFKVARSLDVGGTPTSIVAVGGSGEAH